MTSAIENYTIQEISKKTATLMNEQPGPIKELGITYQFTIIDEDYAFQMHFDHGVVTVHEELSYEPACTLFLSGKSFKKLLIGQLNGTAAYMMGKLKVNGSLVHAIKMEGLLRQYELGRYFEK
ncbi:Sterol-binding domain-containing protein [Fictibacillus macauensis ZFHKF-1]|uniref:Sterol-binding domain-containing protein n=1 Tax=Fictibacillus macauensis ZFHKF-1 TaxID=1196324 RepID=I8AH61_9BACL|nr:SCP2 sterol-binding domain-containing protein [Fictibacillus macauensis]EIT84769.1 Sterol-binding domain-containing protein [Fictibacillus macauensis ZFHKF-1]